MSPRLLDNRFVWIPSHTHSDPSLFAARQKERMALAQAERDATSGEQQRKVRRIKREANA